MGKAIIGLSAHDGLLDLLKGNARIVSGLPADAQLRNLTYDAMTDRVLLLVEADSYPPHHPGFALPFADVRIEKTSTS